MCSICVRESCWAHKHALHWVQASLATLFNFIFCIGSGQLFAGRVCGLGLGSGCVAIVCFLCTGLGHKQRYGRGGEVKRRKEKLPRGDDH